MALHTDPYQLFQFKTFKISYENILPRLDNPPKNDLKNFLGHCEAWAGSIDDRHNAEESVLFPFLNQRMDFSREIEQHKGIHASLDELLEYIRSSSADSKNFEASKLKTMTQKLRDPLLHHLDEEVHHISRES